MLANNMILSDNAIIEKGTTVLLQELGYAGFIKYLRLLTNGCNDYLKIQEEIYKDMSIDEIFDSASENWNVNNNS